MGEASEPTLRCIRTDPFANHFWLKDRCPDAPFSYPTLPPPPHSLTVTSPPSHTPSLPLPSPSPPPPLQVQLGDLDVNDLRKEAQPQLLTGISASIGPKAGGPASDGSAGIRVATIDNYQVRVAGG